MEAHLTGAFPRSEQLVEATRAADRGKLSGSDVDRAFDRDVIGLVELQRDVGLDSYVDGQLNWQDLFRPFSEVFTGIRLGGLIRWFDNNTFYRQPTVVDKIGFRTSDVDLGRFFRHALIPSAPRKAILPSPFTFAVMAQNSAYKSLADLVDDFGHALKRVATELQNVGYSHLQVNEPALCMKGTKQDFELAKRGLEACTSGFSGKTILQTYFFDAAPVIDSLLDCPVNCIGLDFYATPVDAISRFDFDKELGCGCIDGRNSLLETPEGVHDFVSNVQETLEPKSISLGPNCDLDFLPQPVAQKKVRVLAESRVRLNT